LDEFIQHLERGSFRHDGDCHAVQAAFVSVPDAADTVAKRSPSSDKVLPRGPAPILAKPAAEGFFSSATPYSAISFLGY
jgi:hypothetical protein